MSNTGDGQFLRTTSFPISPEDAGNPAAMLAIRNHLLEELQGWADRCGYTRHEVRATTSTDSLTLTALMVPRTDGDWPLIHQAIAEDVADRNAARQAERRLDPRGDPF